jgi:hypothetical protein
MIVAAKPGDFRNWRSASLMSVMVKLWTGQHELGKQTVPENTRQKAEGRSKPPLLLESGRSGAPGS